RMACVRVLTAVRPGPSFSNRRTFSTNSNFKKELSATVILSRRRRISQNNETLCRKSLESFADLSSQIENTYRVLTIDFFSFNGREIQSLQEGIGPIHKFSAV